MAGRGRAFLFQTPKSTEDSSSAISHEPQKRRGRGRACFLLQGAKITGSSTVSSDSEISVLTSSAASGSENKPKSMGRAQGLSRAARLYGSKSSSLGICSEELSANEVQISVARESPIKEEPPPVVKHGISGTRRDVTSNYVALDLLDPNKGIWEYEVVFNPDIESKYLRSKLANMHFLTLGGEVKAYDTGNRLFTPMKTVEEVTSGYYDSNAGDKIQVTFIRKSQKKFSECQFILNIIMNKMKRELNLVRFGRFDFTPKDIHVQPKHKLEIWPGCVSTVGEYEGGLFLNFDVSHQIVQTGSIYDLICECKRVDGSKFKSQVTKQLLGLSFITKYNKNNHRPVRIDDIDFTKTPMSTFVKNDGKEISYVEYYKKQYDITIKDRNQPMLLNRVRKKPQEMTEDKLNYYVPELCTLRILTDAQKSNTSLMKDVIAICQKTPVQRNEALRQFLKAIHENGTCQKYLNDWGLKLPTEPVQLMARIFDPEKIYFRNDHPIQEPNANWNRQAMTTPMLSVIDLKEWVILYTVCDERLAKNFYHEASVLASDIGMTVYKPEFVRVVSKNAEGYCTKIKDRSESKIQIVVTLFTHQRNDYYMAIKKLCNSDLGLPSQVIVSHTLRKNARTLRSVVKKLLLQMNCKLGGSIWGVHIPYKEDGIMFCGIDVYHEASQSRSSVIAMVSSIDKTATRWTSATDKHNRGQEISDSIAVLFRQCLQQWYFVNHMYPKRIVIFRDGVGNGQLRTVKDFEIPQVRNVCQNVSEEYKPMLTYMIVQKRINTRFYTSIQKRSLDNPPPGTVLDNTITRRNSYDFFLVCQDVRQGTVSPTHFVVIEDNSDMSPDQAQKLAYKMTHLYYNWTGTVRVPAPCQYAHKLAYLVGKFLNNPVNPKLKDTLYFL